MAPVFTPPACWFFASPGDFEDRVLQGETGEWLVLAESPLPPGSGTVVPEGLAGDGMGHLYYAAIPEADTYSA